MAPNQLTETVETIARELGETQLVPRLTIQRIVQRLGTETALAVLQETLAIEASGGMMLPDGSRRRTPGGVFFQRVRARLSPADHSLIFPSAYQRKKHAKAKAKPPPKPQAPPLTWDNRLTLISPSLEEKGAATTVKITLIGRPGQVINTAECMVTTLQSGKIPPLPKGMPKPPETPTLYVVYIAHKQWRKVAEALQKPEDVLIVEGYPAFDPELKGLAVFATNVTTKLLQAAKRQESV